MGDIENILEELAGDPQASFTLADVAHKGALQRRRTLARSATSLVAAVALILGGFALRSEPNRISVDVAAPPTATEVTSASEPSASVVPSSATVVTEPTSDADAVNPDQDDRGSRVEADGSSATPEPTVAPVPEPTTESAPDQPATPTATPNPAPIATPSTAPTVPEPSATELPGATSTPIPPPTPTPPATATPIPAPTASPSAVPTPPATTTPIPAPTATPSAVPTATPLPTATSTPTPTPSPTLTSAPPCTSALGGSAAFASGQYGPEYVAANALDGQPRTMWISEVWQTPAILGYSVDTSGAAVSAYEIRFNNGEPLSTRAPKDWTFEGSDDDENWVVLDTRTRITQWTGARQIRSFNLAENEVPYRAYRLVVTEDNDEREAVVVISISELRVFAGCQFPE